MAAELGKLAELVRRRSTTPRASTHTLISGTSNYLLERKLIPPSLASQEGDAMVDTLTNIADKLEPDYKTGATFIRHLNSAFNESGVLTDKKQKQLVFEERKVYSTSKAE